LFEHPDIKSSTLFLWRNRPCIVIGRWQNPWKECDHSKMQGKEVKLARRRSGGGAVYQDLGNTCFTFIHPIPEGGFAMDTKEINNKILLKALKNLGITAEVSGRNDILVDGFKVSGSAYKANLGMKRSLHHGTMLVDVNLDDLKTYLNPDKPKLESKGVDSVIKRVANLI
jgi:lipoate-protein ligase A